MEEVPAHVHPGSIVTDVLSRQHEHRSGLIWSGDRDTCYTNLQCSAVNNDDDEVDGSEGDEAVSSQSESDDDNDPEEGEFQTPLNPVNPVNPVTDDIVQQWKSSQWFSNARYDYTQFGALLDMGSGSPIDDNIEFGTVRLLD
ncbi:hypothetical protein M9H77_33856 [Catharanthus roseus]|uniref:Uncharacterized protein n=1 Tax=Catharanthus roseus TaxID=4058 RepID=A0ACB9ZKQ4_CATRO|nr:hypothetical protein M9H77_33856 [Catharanthus roseus]